MAVREAPVGAVRGTPNPWRSLTFAALCAFWFTLPWEGVVRFGEGTTIGTVVGGGAAGAALIALAVERPRSRPGDFVILTLAFTVWVGLSAFWTQAPEWTYERIITMSQLAVLVLLAWEFARTPARVRWLMMSWVAGSALLATIVILAFLAGQGTTRYTAPGTHPGDVSFVLALSIPIAWYLSFTTRHPLTTALTRLHVPFAVLAITLTASRAGFLGLAVVLALVPLTVSRMSTKGKVLVALATGTSALVLTALSGLLAAPLSRLATTGAELESGTLSQRTDLWAIGWRIFGENPLLGVGAGTARTIVGGQFIDARGLHSAYLSVAAELGAVGLCLFLLIILAALWPAVRHTPPLERRFAAVLGLFFLMSQLTRHAEYDKTTWAMLITLALLGSVMARSTRPAAPGPSNPSTATGLATVPGRFPGGRA